MFQFDKPSVPQLRLITASDAPWYQFSPPPADRAAKFYQDAFQAVTFPATAGRAVSLAVARVAYAKRQLFPALRQELEEDPAIHNLLQQGAVTLPPSFQQLDKWLEQTRVSLAKRAADAPEGKLLAETSKRADLAFLQLKNFVSRPEKLQQYRASAICSPDIQAPKQPERCYLNSDDEKASAFVVSPHLKVAGHHNNVTLFFHFRTCAQDVALARKSQADTCPFFGALVRLNAIVEAAFTSAGIEALENGVAEAERARGTFNQQLGAAVEDELFSLAVRPTPADLRQFMALFLLSAPRNASDWSITRFGKPPKVAKQGPTTTAFVHPLANEVDAWCDWLHECHEKCTPQFIEECRAHGWPCVLLLKGVRYYNGRAQMGEFDLALCDAVTNQVLSIGEIKASATDLIGARKQRQRLVQLLQREQVRIDQCIARGVSPAPTELDGLYFLHRDKPTAPLTLASFEYFSLFPVYRWVMISYNALTPTSSRAPGRISWRLLRDVGHALGYYTNDDPSAFPTDDAALQRAIKVASETEGRTHEITSAMRQSWMMISRKEGFESPWDLIKEAESIDFCNLLLIRR